MRITKYRGKSDNEWVYGSLLITGTGSYYIVPQNLIGQLPQWPVDKKTVTQCIGTTDILPIETGENKTSEIYEGDIVFDVLQDEKYVLTWDENYAQIFMKNVIEDVGKEDYDLCEYDTNISNTLYLIGNIFDDTGHVNKES